MNNFVGWLRHCLQYTLALPKYLLHGIIKYVIFYGTITGESQDLNDVDSHGMFNYEINDDFSKFDRYGDDDDEELESIERNDAIFHKSFATVSRPGSDEDWDGVAATDFSFERSLSFNSERVDDDQKDISMDSGEVCCVSYTIV